MDKGRRYLGSVAAVAIAAALVLETPLTAGAAQAVSQTAAVKSTGVEAAAVGPAGIKTAAAKGVEVKRAVVRPAAKRSAASVSGAAMKPNAGHGAMASVAVPIAPRVLTAANTFTCTDSWTGGSGDWSNPAHWSKHAVPSTTDDACITAAGNYIVTAEGSISVDAVKVGSGTAGHAEELQLVGQSCSSNASFQTANSTQSQDQTASTGTIDLTSANLGCGSADSSLTVAGTLLDSGTVISDGGAGGARTITGSVVDQGTVEVNLSLAWSGSAWDNKGALDLADGQSMSLPTTGGGTFTDDAGGSVVPNGPSGTGQLIVPSGTYKQAGGTTATGPGVPVIVQNASLAYSSAGGSDIDIEGSSKVSGTVPAGSVLSGVALSCSMALSLSASNLAVAGSVHLTDYPDGCGNTAANLTVKTGTLTVASGGQLSVDSSAGLPPSNATLTGPVVNDGTISIVSATTYWTGTTWTNQGAVAISAGVDLIVPPTSTSPAPQFADSTGGSVSGTGNGQLQINGSAQYTQGAGSASSVVVVNANLVYAAGAGTSDIVVEGTSTLAGTIPAGSVLSAVALACGPGLGLSASGLTVAGTMHMTDAEDGCGNGPADLTVSSGSLTVAAGGLLSADSSAGLPPSLVNLTGAVVNDGSVSIVSAPVAWSGSTWQNQGALTVGTGVTMSVGGSSEFDDLSGGSVTGAAHALQVAGTYVQGPGTTSTTAAAVVVGSAVLVYGSGAGASDIDVEGPSTVSGTVPAGSVLSAVALSCGPSLALSASGMTVAGTMHLTDSPDGCGEGVAGLSVTSGTFTVAPGGTVSADSSAGLPPSTVGVSGPVVNDGTVTFSTTSGTLTSTTWQNQGSLTIAGGLTVVGDGASEFENLSGGSVTGPADGLQIEGTYLQGPGTTATTAAPVLVQSGTLEYATGAGTSDIDVWGNATLTGNFPAGSVLNAVSLSCGPTLTATAASFTVAGTMHLTAANNGCGSAAEGLATSDGITVSPTGLIQADDSAGVTPSSVSITGPVTDGGVVSTLSIAGGSGPAVTVDGPLTLTGSGLLSATDAGQITVPAGGLTNYTTSSTGTTSLSGDYSAAGGRIELDGVDPVTITGSLNLSGASASIDDGNTAITPYNIAQGAFLTLTGGATLYSPASGFDNAGTVEVGEGSKLESVAQYYQESTGLLIIHVGGTGSAQYGTVSGTGPDALAGTLRIVRDSGWSPAPTTSIAVLGGPGGSGSFTTVDSEPATTAGWWVPTYVNEGSGPFTVYVNWTGISVSPTTAYPGQTVTLNGYGFAPGSKVTARVGSAANETYTASSTGSISGGFVIPVGTAGGSSTITATGAGGSPVFTTPFTVEAPTATTTGLSATPIFPDVSVPVTYSATVSPTAATGKVAFSDAGTAIPGCSAVALKSGKATCTVTYSANGTHQVTARFAGTPAYTTSTSSQVMVFVGNFASSSVSCPPGGAGCMVAGSSYAAPVSSQGNSFPSALVQSDLGGAWTFQYVPAPSGTWAGSALSSLSCPTVAWCVATGSVEDSSLNRYPYAEVYSGGTWTPAMLPAPTAGQVFDIQSVSCPAAGTCTATGFEQAVQGGSATGAVVERYAGGAWSVSTPAGAYSLGSVSCPSTTMCRAIGLNSAGQPVAATWNGSTWTVTVLSAGGLYPQLEAVSCPSTTWCYAVGNFYNTTAGNTEPLTATFANGAWTTSEQTSLPSGVTRLAFEGVACTGAKACQAVGYWSNGSVTLPAVQTLTSKGVRTSTSMPLSGGPQLAGENDRLHSISCSSATSCLAAGYRLNNTFDSDLLESLTGSAWKAS